MVQTFPSNRADQPLHIGILPGTLEPTDHLLHAQRPQPTAKLFPVDLVPVTNDISLTPAFPERLHHLLTRPFCRRMLRDAEMQHSSASCSITRNTNSTRSRIVATVKKSIATASPVWFRRKVLQFCEGRRGIPRSTRDTVRSDTAIPNFCNSP